MLEQKYMQVLDNTEGKLTKHLRLSENMELTPDTDLRRDFRYSEQTLESPDVIRTARQPSKYKESENADMSTPLKMPDGGSAIVESP